jgi:membrane peptidoglycan carboxypeptidase
VREEVAAEILEMLEGVVSPDGTGGLAGLKDVRVGGKTGTPQKYDSDSQTFSQDRYEAWFMGVVPADAPRLVIVVRVDEAQRPAHTGGATAAPLFARVAAAQLTRYGIFTEPEPRGAELVPTVIVARNESLPSVSAAPKTPASRPQPAAARPSEPSAAEPPQPNAERPSQPSTVERLTSLGDRVLLPDFRGRTVDEVRQMTAGRIEVKLSGHGRAVTQQPPPGTIFALDSGPVTIRFEAQTAKSGEEES